VLAARNEAAVTGSEDEMPLDYMIRVMRDPTTEPHRRDAMAKAAAPYLHPQLAAIHHRHANADGTPIAPVIHLTINAPALVSPKPKLTHTGPNDDETVQ